MTVDALASEVHFGDHIRPVWDALPERGTWYDAAPVGEGLPIIVASHSDCRRSALRPTIYMEHGAGQTYGGVNGSYAGAGQKDNVRLFLNPSERVAALNRAAWPDARQAVIGSPLLDRWIGYRPRNVEPVVALAWHWDARHVADEARSALPFYLRVLPRLRQFKLLGHGHPRAMPILQKHYERLGIEWTDNFSDVLARADLLVFDNTSAGFLFAATGRPVVVLDAPWYQKEWGGRFWDWASVGVRVKAPAELPLSIERALDDTNEQRAERERVSRLIFGDLDGRATERAVAAIMEWRSTCP